MSPEIKVLLIAMTPVSELNGSIPIGLTILNLPFWKTFLISLFGNIIPVVVLLSLLGPTSRFLSKRSKTSKKFFRWLFMRTRKKIRPKVERYGRIGLVSFVSLPFPLTGGWTGAIAAFLIGIPFSSAFLTITFGTLIKGIIISALTLSGIAIERYFGWETLLIIVTISFLAYFVKKIRINKSPL